MSIRRGAILPVLFGVIAICGRSLALDEHPGWPIELDYDAHPAVADLDGDGTMEIIIPAERKLHVYREDGSMLEGWPFDDLNESYFNQRPRIGDVDGDGEPEVVAVSFWWIYVLSAEGKLEDGSPFLLSIDDYFQISDFNLSDLDGDGDLEILAIDYGNHQLHAVHGDGTPVEGWPADIRPDIEAYEIYYADFACGDLDFDGTSEVVVGAYAYEDGSPYVGVPLLVLNGDGTRRDGFPWAFRDNAALLWPGIADFDGDYSCEIFGAFLNSDFCLTADGGWHMSAQSHSGGVERPSAAADLDGDGIMELIVPKRTLRVYDTSTRHGDATLAETGGLDSYNGFEGVTCGDVDGDGSQEVFAWTRRYKSEHRNFLHVLDRDLNELTGWPIEMGDAGVAAQDSPILTDLDNDGDLEGVVAYPHNPHKLHVFAFEKTGDAECKVDWPTVGHDATHAYYAHTGYTPAQVFLRGDANGDERVNIVDAVLQLRYLFLGFETDCPAAFDIDADADIGLGDAIDLLDYLFGDGKPPVEPYPACGAKPKGEKLKCLNFECN